MDTPLAEVGRALSAAGIRALVVAEREGLPSVEILVERGRGSDSDEVLADLDWQWRTGGDGFWRALGRRRYQWAGGFGITVDHRLPVFPLPARAFRALERRLWDGAVAGPDGLLRPTPEAIGTWRRLEALRGIPARDAAPVPGGPLFRVGSRVARRIRRLARRWPIADGLLGEPWRAAIVRVRFDGLPLLVGPGTYLPRRVSEELVAVAAARLEAERVPFVVDAGTGAGAIALALARRLPGASVLGTDIDPGAIAWATRNARRLGIANARFATGSLLDPLPPERRGDVTAVVANMPCLAGEAYSGGADAPAEAYVGGDDDGLGLHRALAVAATGALRPGGLLIVHVAEAQVVALSASLDALGYEPVATERGRVVVHAARWPGGGEGAASPGELS